MAPLLVSVHTTNISRSKRVKAQSLQFKKPFTSRVLNSKWGRETSITVTSETTKIKYRTNGCPQIAFKKAHLGLPTKK
jgi:hypothetical protein